MFAEKILQFFPAPAYLMPTHAGLIISEHHIRAIRFARVGKNLKVAYATSITLPAGALSNGTIVDRSAVLNALVNMRKKIGTSCISLGFSEDKGYLFEITIPKVAPKDVRGAIEFKLEENEPLPADQVVFDYVVTDHTHDTITAVVSVAPISEIETMTTLLSEAGFTVIDIEPVSQAAARALISPEDMSMFLVVHVGSSVVSVSIVSKGIVRFSSSIPYAPSQPLGPEIQKIIAYWKNERPESGESPSKIIVCGADFPERIIADLSSTGIPAEFGNVWTRVADINVSVPDIPREDSLAYAATVGLALPRKTII